jgi:hypothetical protein
VDVFRRREIKFLLSASERTVVEAALRQRMVPDEHGVSTVCNLYYDTEDFRLIRRSLEHPVYKEKLRLRCYGIARPGADLFLELKKKYKGVVYKRRVKVTEPEAMAFMEGRGELRKQNQISREIRYVRDFYATLAPRVYLCYDREAWYDPKDRGFRMTLDRNIRYRTADLTLGSDFAGTALLSPDQSLLEVKAEGAVPLWLVHLLSQQGIRKQSFSKYGTVYRQLLEEYLMNKRGNDHASNHVFEYL